jgi:prepilin-type N-terminal cleavage/methylation domain-containing protein
MTTQPSSSQPTGGFTLVEVMVSMTLLSMASLALGTMLFRAARQANATSASSYQTAMVNAEASRLSALPFDQLPAAGTTCVNITTPFAGTKCTTINNVSTKVKQVTVVITPSGNPLLQPITSSFTRTISGNGNPLKSP